MTKVRTLSTGSPPNPNLAQDKGTQQQSASRSEVRTPSLAKGNIFARAGEKLAFAAAWLAGCPHFIQQRMVKAPLRCTKFCPELLRMPRRCSVWFGNQLKLFSRGNNKFVIGLVHAVIYQDQATRGSHSVWISIVETAIPNERAIGI